MKPVDKETWKAHLYYQQHHANHVQSKPNTLIYPRRNSDWYALQVICLHVESEIDTDRELSNQHLHRLTEIWGQYKVSRLQICKRTTKEKNFTSLNRILFQYKPCLHLLKWNFEAFKPTFIEIFWHIVTIYIFCWQTNMRENSEKA